MGILGKLKFLSRLRTLFSHLIVFPLSFVLAGITMITGRLVGREVWQRRNWQRAQGLVKSTRLTPEELALAQDDLNRGDYSAAERRIASAQENSKTALRAAGVEVDTFTLLIGRDICWADIIGHVFRVCDFDRAGTTIGPRDKVRAGSRFQPYGYLLVESPILNQPAKLPICHRDDFLLASTVFDDPKLAHVVTQAELLVTYVPKHRLPGGCGFRWHALHYVIVPSGTLQRYYQVGGNANMASPAPEKLFGRFVYRGEIRVETNRDPQFS